MIASNTRSRLALALVLLALFSVGVYFWLDAALRYFLHFDESVFRRYWPNRGWLTTHIAGGTLALLLGPFQFWTGLKRRQPKLHRLLGYTYSLGILLGGATSFVLAFRASIPDFGFSLFFLGVAWWVTLGMALIAIRNRRFDAHRDWMIRSYIVTFGFVTFRYVVKWELLNGLGRGKLASAGWACWVVPLLIAEIFLHWKSVAPQKRTTTQAEATPSSAD
jgi:hypothetical protein